MTITIEVVSFGRLETVAGAELDELRETGASWLIYGEFRRFMTHDDAIATLRGASACAARQQLKPNTLDVIQAFGHAA